MAIIVLFGIVISVAWVIWLIVNRIRKIVITSKSKKNINEMNTYLSTMQYFKMEQVQFSISGNLITNKCLAIDDNNKLICILEARNNCIKEKIYKYEVLQYSEIVRNGISVTKASLSDAFIREALFVETGAIVGGLTSKMTTSNNVNEICLIVIFNDSANSVYKFNFIEYDGAGISKNDLFYYMEIARNWHGLLSVIIKRNEEERVKANGWETT